MSREGWHRYGQELVWLKGARGGLPILRSLPALGCPPRVVSEMPLPHTAAAQRSRIHEMGNTPPVWIRWTSPQPPE